MALVSDVFGQGPFAGDADPSPQLVEDAGIALDEGVVSTRTPSPWRRAGKRLLRDKPAVIALAFLLLMIFMAVFASLIAPHDPDAIPVGATPFDTPSLDHPFGTDHNGRDTFSRVVYGARVSLRSGFQIVGVALLIAVPLGLLAGFRGGGTDVTLMRVMDGLASFPPLVLALAVVGVLGAGLENVILAISLVMIPGFARLTRGADARGAGGDVHRGVALDGHAPGRIRRKRVLPNVASPLIVAVSLAIGFASDRRGPAQPARFRRAAPDVELGLDDPATAALYLSEHPWQVYVPSIALGGHDPRVQHARRRHPRLPRARHGQGQAAHQGPPWTHHRHETHRPGPAARLRAAAVGHRTCRWSSSPKRVRRRWSTT